MFSDDENDRTIETKSYMEIEKDKTFSSIFTKKDSKIDNINNKLELSLHKMKMPS